MDRFIKWGKTPEWGAPTIERLAQTARDFLGPTWEVRIRESWIVCETQDRQSFALRSERDDLIKEGPAKGRKFGELLHEEASRHTRGFEIFFLTEGGKIKQTSVITRLADEFTGALADQYAKLIARWWNGTIKWPT